VHPNILTSTTPLISSPILLFPHTSLHPVTHPSSSATSTLSTTTTAMTTRAKGQVIYENVDAM
jgi:hypothetical protein